MYQLVAENKKHIASLLKSFNHWQAYIESDAHKDDELEQGICINVLCAVLCLCVLCSVFCIVYSVFAVHFVSCLVFCCEHDIICCLFRVILYPLFPMWLTI